MAVNRWWTSFAACRDEDPELFFEPDYDARFDRRAEEKRIRAARAVCSGCPVASVCLDYALQWPETFGIWGGETPEGRSAIKQRMRRQYKRLAG